MEYTSCLIYVSSLCSFFHYFGIQPVVSEFYDEVVFTDPSIDFGNHLIAYVGQTSLPRNTLDVSDQSIMAWLFFAVPVNGRLSLHFPSLF